MLFDIANSFTYGDCTDVRCRYDLILERDFHLFELHVSPHLTYLLRAHSCAQGRSFTCIVTCNCRSNEAIRLLEDWATVFSQHYFRRLTKILPAGLKDFNLRPRPYYTGKIWKQCFYPVNASNVFRHTHAGDIQKPNNRRSHFGYVFGENTVIEITRLS